MIRAQIVVKHMAVNTNVIIVGLWDVIIIVVSEVIPRDPIALFVRKLQKKQKYSVFFLKRNQRFFTESGLIVPLQRSTIIVCDS